jgi:3-phosphoshikimate 1-carboxyvinyltransferase
MKATVTISEVAGKLPAPTSKSALQRYIAGALLAKGHSEISAASFCDDSLAALSIAQGLGAEVSVNGKIISISGGIKNSPAKISCGESGLSARMFTPIASLTGSTVTMNGKGSILKRPLDMVEEPLAKLGVSVESANGFLPLKIKGPLRGGEVRTDGSVSSQFVTGLLMALPLAEKDSRLIVDNLVSKPYIDLTLHILDEFGLKILNSSYREFSIAGSQKYLPGNYTAEGDWSGAAFLLVMAAIGGSAEVGGLLLNSTQADKAIIDALRIAGAAVTTGSDSVKVEKRDLECFEFNVSECPDLAPPLAVLALACKGKSVITGTERLAAKESDRGMALEETLNRIGGRVINYSNRIEIEGGVRLGGGRAASHNDHRIAMALATAALLSDSPVIIDGMECINKSYPGFIDDFVALGGKVSLEK